MQPSAGLVITALFFTASVVAWVAYRHPISFDLLSQDALVAFGVGIAVGLIVVPAIDIPWAFVRHGSTLTLPMLTAYDQNGLMFSLIAGAVASAYLALKTYADRFPRRPKPDDSASTDDDHTANTVS